jgi:hypothetical protein
MEAHYPDLRYLFSTLKGVRLPIGLAKKAKAAGNKRGVPDIWLPVRRGKYAGLVIELKHGDNKPSDEQLDWLKFLNSQGFCAALAWGADEAISLIERYLDGAT